jgi:RecA-family ATPase
VVTGPVSPKPTSLPFTGLPDIAALSTLSKRRQWVAWDHRWNAERGAWAKVPICPRNGLPARSNDSSTWDTYDEAAARVRRSNLAGVGFMLADDDDLTGIDLDNVRDPISGEFEPWAAELLAMAETYAEMSPSGRGVRLFALGKIPRAIKVDAASVEMYGRGRYLTVTGHHLDGTPETLGAAPLTIAALTARVEAMRAVAQPSQASLSAPLQRPASVALAARKVGAAEGATDIFRRVNDAAMKKLEAWVPTLFPSADYHGSTGAYRISSKELGRDLQEDLSIAPNGIVDFGVHDMGDPNEGKRTPIDLLIEHGGAPDAVGAARWLASTLGIDFTAEWDAARADSLIDLSRLQPSKQTMSFGRPDADVSELGIVVASHLSGVPIPPRLWHVPELIPAHTVTTLNGDGGTGKSLIALQLAVATALGARWLGNNVQQGCCLFLTAEDDLDEVHRRLHDICSSDGVDLSSLGNLLIAPLAGEDALLAIPDPRKGGVLQATALFARVERAVMHHQPRLVVLDTLADLFGGDEVNRAQARQFIGMLRGLALHHSTTVLLLAHPSLAGMSSGTGSSGSTAWNNSVRSRLYLRRIVTTDDKMPIEADPDIRSLSTMKSNYGRTGGEIIVRWRDGRFVPDLPEPETPLSASAAKNRAERVFKELLRAYLVAGRNVSCNPSSTYAPSIFCKDGRAEGVTRRGFTDAMNNLFARGEIESVQFGPASKGRTRIDFRCQRSTATRPHRHLPTPFRRLPTEYCPSNAVPTRHYS